MNDTLIILLADIFNKRVNDGKDGFLLIKFSVPVRALNELYERLKTIDVPPIETLSEDQKLIYWNIAKTYHKEELKAINGSKAAYILALITNSN